MKNPKFQKYNSSELPYTKNEKEFNKEFDSLIKCQNQRSLKKDNNFLYVAPSGLDSEIAGLFTRKFIKKGDYVTDYKGKIDKNI